MIYFLMGRKKIELQLYKKRIRGVESLYNHNKNV